MQSRYKKTALALACLTAAPLYANERLEEMTVVSSRVEMPLRQVGTSISVIDAEELEIRGFDGLANTLRYEPGISVNNNGGAGKTTSLRIRGERSFRTKLFIDGIEATDTSSPQAGPNFANLASAAIERVEILRGPQGMMYGADAGGVVAITTRAPGEGLSGGVSAEYGRYSSYDLQAYVAGGSETGDFALSAAQYETDGFNARSTDTDLQDDDGYENSTLHARAGWNITETVRLEGVGRMVSGENEYDDCSDVTTFAPLNDCSNDYDQTAWRAALVQRNDRMSNTLAYNAHSTEREFYSADQTSFTTEGELEELGYLGSLSASDAIGFVYGAEFRSESIDDGSSDTDRDQRGYFAEYQGTIGDALYLTAGARYDDNDDFGSETTYRLSGAYLIDTDSAQIKLKGTYGTGFRAPSLSEISYNQGPFATPPAAGVDLGAEQSEGYDVGVAYYANSGWMLELIYFDQTIDKEIYFDLVNFSGYLQGADESSSQGMEVITEIPMGASFAMYGNYTYNDTEDTEGEQRARAPKHLGNIGLRYSPPSVGLVVNLNLRASHDSPQESNGTVDDYEVLDISARYAFSEELEVFGRVENLTDENYQELPTFNTSGAAAYVGVSYAF